MFAALVARFVPRDRPDGVNVGGEEQPGDRVNEVAGVFVEEQPVDASLDPDHAEGVMTNVGATWTMAHMDVVVSLSNPPLDTVLRER